MAISGKELLSAADSATLSGALRHASSIIHGHHQCPLDGSRLLLALLICQIRLGFIPAVGYCGCRNQEPPWWEPRAIQSSLFLSLE